MGIKSNSAHSLTTPLHGVVFEIQKLSTQDGPGIRTTVFLKECPLQCAWCHNPESIKKEISIQWFQAKCIGCETCVDVCPEQAISWRDSGILINRELCTGCEKCVEQCPSTAMKAFGKRWTVDDLLEEILKDKSYYETSNGGVTFSGGEPTMQAPFLEAILVACKEHGIHTALDTCGLTSQEKLTRLLPHLDLVLYDLKEIDPQKHRAFTGVTNTLILENCIWLANKMAGLHKELWIRTPLIPGYTATAENIAGIRDFIRDQMGCQITRWDLLAFNNLAASKYTRMDLTWPFATLPLFTREEMAAFHSIANKDGGIPNVEWSGLTRE